MHPERKRTTLHSKYKNRPRCWNTESGYENDVVTQRVSDGYFNATAMCKASGKKMSRYLSNDTTKWFISELFSDIGIPISGLVQSIKGGDPHLQDTWVYPQAAINLAQWLFPKFAVLVSKWVSEWMSGNIRQPTLPYHLRRHEVMGYIEVSSE